MAQRGRPPKIKTDVKPATAAAATTGLITVPADSAKEYRLEPSPAEKLARTPVNKPVTTPVTTPIAATPAYVDHPKVESRGFWSELWEKIPLGLTVSYQSFIVGLWSYRELVLANRDLPAFMNYAYALFSAFAGLSLDLVMIGTALRKDKKGTTHLATLFSAWIASSAIAFSYFPGTIQQRMLHITWSTMVFLFSWSLAEGRGSNISLALSQLYHRIIRSKD